VKILVALKRVADPDNANKVKIPAAGDKVDTTGLEWKPNPFDEYALEAALRLTENGQAPKPRVGEVTVVTFGPKETETTLRSALATGAALDGDLVARALAALVQKEKPDLVVLGKQAVDGDSNQVGQLVAEYLDWPQATFAATIEQEAAGTLVVGREVDGGVAKVRLKLPALITVDLRIVAGTSVYSAKTPKTFKYNDSVRYAKLPDIMAAKKKPLTEMKLSDLVSDVALKVVHGTFQAPPARKAGVKVKDVAELVEKLSKEAKVL
jgi:electron transfer flavoprotein beta subunit